MKEDEVTEKKENGPPGVILRLLSRRIFFTPAYNKAKLFRLKNCRGNKPLGDLRNDVDFQNMAKHDANANLYKKL